MRLSPLDADSHEVIQNATTLPLPLQCSRAVQDPLDEVLGVDG
jgi:hypothetical protein